QFDVGDGGALTPKSPATVAAGRGANGVAVTPDSASVYVTNANDAVINQYDAAADGTLSPKTPAFVSSGLLAFPLEIAASPDGESVYAVNLGNGLISQYDVGADGALTSKTPATVPAGIAPQALTISPDGSSVYVANTGGNNIGQYDIAADGTLSPKTPATVTAPGEPAGITISRDGANVYTANQANRSVSQFDVGAGGVLTAKSPATVSAGRAPSGLTTSADGKSLYVTNFKHQLDVGFNTVSQYDIAADGSLSPKTAPFVQAGSAPNQVAVLPEVELAARAKSSRRPGNIRVRATCDGAPCTTTISGGARIPSDRSRAGGKAAGPKTKRFKVQQRQFDLETGDSRNARVKFQGNRNAVRKITRLLKTTRHARRAKPIVRIRADGPGNFKSKERERIRLAL
ncbi:MAG: lactonase family protein, partial [Solirubrobacterales bacterium]